MAGQGPVDLGASGAASATMRGRKAGFAAVKIVGLSCWRGISGGHSITVVTDGTATRTAPPGLIED